MFDAIGIDRLKFERVYLECRLPASFGPAPRSPWQHGHAERLIGSIRRECLDHVVVFGERHP
jgi:hypothetical protein